MTGSSVSNILGKLGVEGTANLFLINPNGIYFGNGASLDIRGSFTATTADSIKLGENGLFSATNPQSSNLLNVQPNALFINALRNQTAIINNQGNLTVESGQNITLFGADVINNGTLTAPEGTIQLTGSENLIVRGNISTNTLFLETKNFSIGENNNATIYKSILEGLSGNTNLIFQATNDITINPLTNNSLTLSPGIGQITFNANGDFLMNTADTIKTRGRNINISGANLTLGNIDTSLVTGGNLVIDVDNGGAIPPSGTQGTSAFTFKVSEGQSIDDVNLRFSAAHTYDSDLAVSLISPSGTTMLLFNGVGESGDNFQDTLLDDSVATTMSNASAPFNGTFKPSEALSVFHGQNPQGTWQLKVPESRTTRYWYFI